MPLFEEDLHFLSLDIPVSQMREDLSRRYHVHLENGKILQVDAQNAAEAVAKLGIKDNITRISNVGYETRKLLDQDVLDPMDMRVATNISLEENDAAASRLIVTDDLNTKEEIPFSSMNLVEYAEGNLLAHPDGRHDALHVVLDLSSVSVQMDERMPQPVAESVELVQEPETPAELPDSTDVDAEWLGAQDAEEEPDVENGAPLVEAEADRELSPEEVRQLLQG